VVPIPVRRGKATSVKRLGEDPVSDERPYPPNGNDLSIGFQPDSLGKAEVVVTDRSRKACPLGDRLENADSKDRLRDPGERENRK
jgi:hypothetical protein